MNTEQKRGRGRPRGSQSFVTVSLADLNAMFSSNDQIQIGRLWLTQQTPKTSNHKVSASKPVSQQATTANVAPVEMTLSE